MINENNILGVNSFNTDQGTDKWMELRLGVITASNAHLVIMDDKRPPMPKGVEITPTGKRGVNEIRFEHENGVDIFSGTKAECENWYRDKLPAEMTEGKRTYMNELIAQVSTGLVPESVPFKQAKWGHENESYAREAYESRNLCFITEAGLIYKDDSLRCAISPDGLDMDEKVGLEIKCPFTTAVHVNTLLNDHIKPEYYVQCQYSMWVTGWDRWDFCSYDHRMRGEPKNRLHVISVERDPEYMAKFEEKVPQFIKSMDEALEKLGFAFGDQWSIG